MPYEPVAAALRGEAYTYSTMYQRLVDYGLCYLRSGAGRNQQIIRWESDITPERREWSRPEIEAAARLHSRIIRLSLRHNLVLQVFFNESCASFWSEIEPEKQAAIIRDLTLWPSGPPGVNARIRNANRDCGRTLDQPIHPDQFILIRDRSVKMLCNAESLLGGMCRLGDS